MPTLSQTPVHPRFRANITEFANTCRAYDLSTGASPWLVPVSRTVMVEYPDGTKKRHYKNDSTITRMANGRYQFRSAASPAVETKFSKRCRRDLPIDHPDFFGTERLLSYHSSAREDQSGTADWKIGLEVEKVDETLYNDELAWKIFQETGWAKERDGSLGSFGYEIISPILPMTDKKKLRESLATVKKYINANSDHRCGGHINVSCVGKSSRDILTELQSSAGFLYAMYKNRMTNNYCSARPWEEYFDYPTKHSSFYLKNNNILEIRLFPAVKTVKSLLWRVDLLKILLITTKGSFMTKVASMSKKKSWLVWHLGKIYSAAEIKRVAEDAIRYQHTLVKKFNAKEVAKLRSLGYELSWLPAAPQAPANLVRTLEEVNF